MGCISRQSIQRGIVITFLVSGIWGTGGTADAQSPQASFSPVTIETREVELSEADPETNKRTTELKLTNLTGAPADLTAVVENDPDCELTLKPDEVSAAETTAVEVGVPGGCSVDEKTGVSFDITATVFGSERTYRISAVPKEEREEPEWDALNSFIVAAAFFLFAAGLAAVRSPKRLLDPMKGLDDTWTFKDSWVSNVTVVGGVLTGIFGSSEVVKALLGEEAESAIALATVGAAIAAALVLLGPILLSCLRTRDDKDFYFTPLGLGLASATVLTAAAGELYVVYRAGSELDLGGWEGLPLAFLSAFAGLVLLIYAIRSFDEMLGEGFAEAPEPEPSETIEAAEMIVKALGGHAEIDSQVVEEAIEGSTPRAPTPRRRRRSALL